MPLVSIPGIELGAELGRGSHSLVLRGVRGGRAYAVKVPLDASTGVERDVAYRRFLREGIALARARNASLPEVMEIGRAKGVPYLVMELAAGETLGERLERGPLTEPDVVGLARQMASALGAIHAAGLVHRDVKPQNIVFDARSGLARLVDLGSAALLHGTALVGTRAYAAPELLTTEPRAADARTDLYSLGRVLLECLGGAPAGKDPQSATDLLAFSRASPGLRRIVEQLVASDPNGRPTNASELRNALEALGSGQATGPKTARHIVASSLVGRAAEVDQLRRAWAGARRSSQVVFLRGPPGAGKTRLANAFLSDVAGTRATIFRAACHPRDPRAFSAVRQLVDGYLQQCEALPTEERAEALSEVKKLGGEHAALLKVLSPAVARLFRDAPNIPASANAEQAFSEGLSEFLGRLVRRGSPSILFVDDVQWLDPSSRRVLARAVVEAPKRVLFLYSARAGDASPDVKRFVDLFVAKTLTVDVHSLAEVDILDIARDFLATRELAPGVQQALLRLSEGTPLSILELLRTLVDEGVLLPHWGGWQLDSKALSEMHLPRGTENLLAHRIAALDPVTRSVLAAGAIIGMEFDDSLLSVSSADDASSIAPALAEARRAELVEADDVVGHRFIHHSVRDALLSGLDESAAGEIHGRVAEALDRQLGRKHHETDADRLYRVAYHYGLGDAGRIPAERVWEANIAAGEAAVARFDNERAIEFFETAERALARSSRALTPATRLLLGEARLRSGALDHALREFEGVLFATADVTIRAGALLRIATIHEMRFDSNRAWDALEKAFRALGEELPKETALDAAVSVTAWLRRGVARQRRVVTPVSKRERDEMLCALYYQVGRVAFTSGAPGRLVLATLRALEPAERLGVSPSLARAYLAYAFLLTVVGFKKAGDRYFALAQEQARELRDPVVYSHTLQMKHVIAAADGRMADAIDAGTNCLIEYGNWRELGEVCLLSWGMYQIETIRGRDAEAWRWLDLPIQRVNRHGGEPVVHEFLLLAARGALLGLGRENEAPLLLRRLSQVTVAVPKDSGTYVWTFGPRARLFTEKGELGSGFDALIHEFQGLGQEPKQSHLAAFEYYLHIAYARVHACLRSHQPDRSRLVEALATALADLDAAARKIPLFRAHALAVRGYDHFFRGRTQAAIEAFDSAERIGVAEGAPWVLYAVHRGRAHMMRMLGSEAAARDQAVLAESIAREHGSVWRLKWIREEFGLRPGRVGEASDESPTLSVERTLLSEETASLAPGISRARRQLRALVRISQARAQELQPDLQARVVVDELVQALRAERGFLFLSSAVVTAAVEAAPEDPEGRKLEIVAGRDSSGRDIGQTAEDIDQATLRSAAEIGADGGGEITASFCVGTTPRRSAIAAPLIVHDVAVGVVYIDRPLGDGAFTQGDGEVLSALAGQVSIALELASALRARERAGESLRSAEKMDAVARLARGIGHDVNNMLSAVSLTTEAMAQTPGADELVGEDIRAIQGVLRGASELARRLRDIAQGDFGHPEAVRVELRIERMIPVINGLLTPGISFETRLERGAQVFMDPGQFDQVVTNLVINARDAMPEGGRLAVEVELIVLDDAYTREHPRVTPGRYVKLSVADSGHGMDPDVRDKIFEPYFTTKGKRGGTGLGLSSVYWIVSRSGGHIDVTTAPGEGTTFSIYFPLIEHPAPGLQRNSRVSGTTSLANNEMNHLLVK